MRIRTRSFIVMFSQGLTQLATIIVAVVLVRIINRETFGAYQQVNLVYVSLAGIISLQLHNSLYYFVPKLGIEERRTLLLHTFLITIALAMVIGCIMFLGADFIAKALKNPELAPLIRIFSLYPFVERLIILVPAFMISIDRAIRAAVYSVSAAVCRVVAVVSAFAAGCDLEVVMWLLVGIGAFIAAIGCADMVRLSPSGKWRVVRSLFKEQFDYSWPLLVTAVVTTINLKLNEILISAFFGPVEYAVYSCGAKQLPVTTLVTMSISVAMMPNLVMMVERGRIKDALYTWQEAARKCSLVIFPCFAFFLVIGQDFMVFLYSPDYSMAGWPFRIYLLSLPLKVAAYATLFRATGRTGPIAKGTVISLTVNIVVSTVLIILGRKGLLSFVGPMIGTVVASWACWIYLLWRLRQVTNVPFNRIMRWKELGLTLAVCTGCGILLLIIPLPGMPLAAKLPAQAIIYFVGYLSVMLITGMLKEDEKQLLKLPFAAIGNLRNLFRRSR